MPLARISLTLSRHFSLSFIASGRSSGLHPVSSQSCCKYVRAGRPTFAQPYVGVHWSISLMSSSLLLQQCPACLVRLTWIVLLMGGKWPYSWCFLFIIFMNTECSISVREYIYIYIYIYAYVINRPKRSLSLSLSLSLSSLSLSLSLVMYVQHGLLKK